MNNIELQAAIQVSQMTGKPFNEAKQMVENAGSSDPIDPIDRLVLATLRLIDTGDVSAWADKVREARAAVDAVQRR